MAVGQQVWDFFIYTTDQPPVMKLSTMLLAYAVLCTHKLHAAPPEDFARSRSYHYVNPFSVCGGISLGIGMPVLAIGALYGETEDNDKGGNSSTPKHKDYTGAIILGGGGALVLGGIAMLIVGHAQTKNRMGSRLSIAAPKSNELGLAYRF